MSQQALNLPDAFQIGLNPLHELLELLLKTVHEAGLPVTVAPVTRNFRSEETDLSFALAFGADRIARRGFPVGEKLGDAFVAET